MSKKKGFTLVELLAVIVILAIIALISTPIILNVIEESKKGAAEQSALGYIDALEKQIVINSMDEDASNDIGNGTFDIKDLEVNIKGAKPTSGSVTITKGKVETATITIGDYSVTVDENGKATTTKNGTTEEKYTVYANGTAVYYNPVEGKKCSASDYTSANSLSENKVGCMKWYTFNDGGETSSTVNMILDHNTTYSSTVKSNLNGSNSKDELKKLQTESNWKNEARLITADEVAKITGNTLFDSNIDSWYYLDTNSQTAPTGISNYAWLFNYLDENVSGGYWTSTLRLNDGDSEWYWYIALEPSSYAVEMDASSNDVPDLYGIRPVITVSKSVIK